MRRMTLFSLLLNVLGLVIMWAGAIFLFGMLAGVAWALLSWGWSLVQ